jgi:RNA polymerase sigma-70 factor (ECF subfamily)
MKGETTGPSDLELVARLRSRDRAALEVLYDRYAHRVYSLALSIVRDQQAAEDITQELFIHLWQYPHLYESERGAFVSWLLRSARNRAIDVLRRRSRDYQVGVRFDTMSALAQDDPDDLVLRADVAAGLRRALAELDSGLREVLELAYFSGLTQREIAERLGLPLGTVKTRVRTALRRLAEALAGDRES